MWPPPPHSSPLPQQKRNKKDKTKQGLYMLFGPNMYPATHTHTHARACTHRSIGTSYLTRGRQPLRCLKCVLMVNMLEPWSCNWHLSQESKLECHAREASSKESRKGKECVCVVEGRGRGGGYRRREEKATQTTSQEWSQRSFTQ